ncbi:SRPBCC domain-containing protein [Spirosoma areae]
MKKLTVNIVLDAPREKVWDILWNEATYPAWTAPFSEGSRVESTWEEGSKVLFLDGNNEGLVSTVAVNKPNECMSFIHVGTIKDGVEDLDSAETRKWSGASENYTLKTVDGGKTELTVDLDVTDDHKAYFEETWPKALAKLKELAEANA